ncbi:hypothetical protein EJ04DRAFT_521781 [Polyplosphaeria fusca]|uniref:Uncharacterized protein n=1 Tax=Polyplosphaeria fusca TaxID=682080 RepID=A0A9P4V501_9PLEO|nr:hypothetical protein EJ04DRAFT_521781 [Polyplosphaeria fusca]
MHVSRATVAPLVPRWCKMPFTMGTNPITKTCSSRQPRRVAMPEPNTVVFFGTLGNHRCTTLTSYRFTHRHVPLDRVTSVEFQDILASTRIQFLLQTHGSGSIRSAIPKHATKILTRQPFLAFFDASSSLEMFFECSSKEFVATQADAQSKFEVNRLTTHSGRSDTFLHQEHYALYVCKDTSNTAAPPGSSGALLPIP